MERPFTSDAQYKPSLRHHLQKRLGDALGKVVRRGDAEAKLEQQAAKEQEYWSYVRKLKDEVEPHFKMPYNREAGAGGGPEKMRELVNKTKDQEAAYNRWLQNANETQAEGLETRLAQLAEEDKQRRGMARQKTAQWREVRQDLVSREKEYWEHMRAPFQPTINIQGLLARSESELSARAEKNEQKLAAFAEDDNQRWADHSRWLKQVKKPSGHIPEPDARCLSPKQRTKLILDLSAKKKRERDTGQEAYHRFLTNMEEKHAELLKEKVEETKCRSSEMGDREQIIAERTAALQMEQKQSEERHQQFVQTLRHKAKSSPMLVEQAYLPPEFQKMHHHRQSFKQIRRRSAYDVDLGDDDDDGEKRTLQNMSRTR